MRALASLDGAARSAAIRRWQQQPDGGLAWLPDVLAVARERRDQQLEATIVTVARALGPSAEPALRLALAPTTADRTHFGGQVPQGVVIIVGQVNPSLLVTPEALAGLAGDCYASGEAARWIAAAANQGAPHAADDFAALLQAAHADVKGHVLSGGRQFPGEWQDALYPRLRPLLRTRIAQDVVQFFAPRLRAQPQFRNDIGDCLRTGDPDLVIVVAWTLQYERDLARALVPELLAAFAHSERQARASVLVALGSTGVASPEVQDAVCAALADESAESIEAALFAVAVLGIRADGMLDRLDKIAAAGHSATATFGCSALAWSIDPARGAAPRPLDLSTTDRARSRIAAAVLARGAAGPGPEHEAALVQLTNDSQPAVALDAVAALARLPALTATTLQQLGVAARSPRPELAQRARELLLVSGDFGARVLGVALLHDDSAELRQWVADRGDAALSVRVAAAAQVAAMRGLLGGTGSDPATVSAALPPLFDDALSFLLQVAADEARPAARAQALRELAADRLGTPAQASAALAVALQTDSDELRDAAMPLLRRIAQQDRGQALQWWCGGTLAVRLRVGALLRCLDRSLPPLPPWLATRATVGDPELQRQLAEAQAAAGDLGPAAALLASLPSDDRAAVPLLRVLGESPGDARPHVEIALRFALAGPEEVRVAAIAVLARARDGDAQVKSLAEPDNRRLWLRADVDWTPALAAAVLASWPELAVDDRRAALQRIAHLGPVPADPQWAPAFATAWGAAGSWRERAGLVPFVLAAKVAPTFARDDVARMQADARDEVHVAGLALELALGDNALANAARIPTRSPAVRTALLQTFFAIALPDLRLDATTWHDLPADARLPLAEWLVQQTRTDDDAVAGVILGSNPTSPRCCSATAAPRRPSCSPRSVVATRCDCSRWPRTWVLAHRRRRKERNGTTSCRCASRC